MKPGTLQNLRNRCECQCHPIPSCSSEGYGLQTLAKYKRKAENLSGSKAKAAVVKLFYKMKPGTLNTSFGSYSDAKIIHYSNATNGWLRLAAYANGMVKTKH